MAHLDTERISAYIDQELDPADMAAVETHLAECDSCRSEHEELVTIAMMTRALPTYTPRKAVVFNDDERDRDAGFIPILLDFAKPLAVAAIIILVALTGLRLAVDNETNPDSETGEISDVLQDEMEGGTNFEAETSIETTEPADPAPAMAALSVTPTVEAQVSTSRDAEAPADADEAPADTEDPDTPDNDGGFGLAEVLVTGVVLVVAAAAGWRVLTRGRSNRPRA